MIQRRVIAVFLVAFVLGIAATALVFRSPPTPSTQPATAHVEAPPKSSNDDAHDDKDDSGIWPDDADSPEQVIYAQADRMRKSLAHVKARVPGRTNLYLVVFAGDGEENVFRNEAEFVTQLFTERYDDAGHIVQLVNNPQTLGTTPLASLTNLETAIDAIATKMDRENDILMLFLTSHGSSDHVLYVNMDPIPLDQIGPDDLADVLDNAHIRHKVIVVSACYSGAFVDALKDESSMVITAARGDRASFGCGTDSEITDFGRAFFVEGLNHNDSFPGAFATAQSLIDAWETRDGEEHSFPQISTNPEIEAKLRAWRDSIHVGPPVPFVPVSRTSDDLTASR